MSCFVVRGLRKGTGIKSNQIIKNDPYNETNPIANIFAVATSFPFLHIAGHNVHSLEVVSKNLPSKQSDAFVLVPSFLELTVKPDFPHIFKYKHCNNKVLPGCS